MRVFKAIATYLIERRITSSQSMSRWFSPLVQTFQKNFEHTLRDGTFHQYIRGLYELKTINGELASHLLQITLWLEDAIAKIDELEKSGIVILLSNDINFPAEFTEIADKPTILYLYGNVTLLTEEYKVTLVGTREPSFWGKMKASQLAFEAAHCDVVTVSGLASGIDTMVFNETLDAGGKTIAILPQLDWNCVKADNQNALYLSEYPPGELALSKWQFIARNRLLAALSPYTVVIEAPLRSGTLITADLAISYGKTVYVVLPDPNEESSYGGVTFGIQQTVGCFIQSLFDLFYLESKTELLSRYKKLIEKLSRGRISIKEKDNRHLAQADLGRYIHASSGGDLATLDTDVVELHRFGIIKERKNKIVFNFSGFNSWPKI